MIPAFRGSSFRLRLRRPAICATDSADVIGITEQTRRHSSVASFRQTGAASPGADSQICAQSGPRPRGRRAVRGSCPLGSGSWPSHLVSSILSLAMKPYDQNIVTFEAMFIGYVDALNRFEVVAKDHDPASAYVPVFEALNWACALDDRTAAHFAPEGKPLGFGWRKRIANAEVMGGVRYARNSVHHQWSDAMLLSGSESVFREWVWRPADDLPPPDKRPNSDGERFYRQQIEGHSVAGSLNVLGGVFLTLQHMLEPHTIPHPDWFAVPVAYDEEADGYYPGGQRARHGADAGVGRRDPRAGERREPRDRADDDRGRGRAVDVRRDASAGRL